MFYTIPKYNSENKAKSLKRVSRMRESNYWSLTENALGMAGLPHMATHVICDILLFNFSSVNSLRASQNINPS